MTITTFTPERAPDLIDTINAATATWPHCRPVGPELLAYWQASRPEFCPDTILMSYSAGGAGGAGRCTGILHGELHADTAHIHLLALRPDPAHPSASDTGTALIAEWERIARQHQASRLVSPTWRASLFYGGHILGNEPYHPHWATSATDAYLRNGFRISHPALILTCNLPIPSRGAGLQPATPGTPPMQAIPDGYQIIEVTPSPEYGAQVLGFHALHSGTKAAHCYARLYANLLCSSGQSTGQIGNVTTEPDHRNRGLARIMVAMSLQRLADMGAGQALIATGLDNAPALRAYERCGFERKHFIMEWSKVLK